MANISGTKLEQNKVIKSLREKGYLSQSFKNSNITIWVNMGSGEEIMNVINFDNLGNQIMAFIKPGYKLCEHCSKLIKIKGANTKYCPKCARGKELEKYIKYNEKR